MIGKGFCVGFRLWTLGFRKRRADAQARPENHNPWRKRGTALATTHPMQDITARPSCLRDVPPDA